MLTVLPVPSWWRLRKPRDFDRWGLLPAVALVRVLAEALLSRKEAPQQTHTTHRSKAVLRRLRLTRRSNLQEFRHNSARRRRTPSVVNQSIVFGPGSFATPGPFFLAGAAVLYQGDCLEIMPTLPSASVDLILCDLPYGTTQCTWDVVIPFVPLWENYWRVAKVEAPVVLTATQPFTAALVLSQLKFFKYEWVWDKVNRLTGGLMSGQRPMRRHESILVFAKSKFTYNAQPLMKVRKAGSRHNKHGRYLDGAGDSVKNEYSKPSKDPVPHTPESILSIAARGHGEEGLHPTQKPVLLMEYLIKTYTNPGDTVLDNCMGSGTTGVACKNTGRNFIGIERDPAYFEIARKRIQPMPWET